MSRNIREDTLAIGLAALAFAVFFGVYYWCLATRLKHRYVDLVAVFVAGACLGLAIGYLIVPYNWGIIIVLSLTSGMSNVVGVQVAVARM